MRQQVHPHKAQPHNGYNFEQPEALVDYFGGLIPHEHKAAHPAVHDAQRQHPHKHKSLLQTGGGAVFAGEVLGKGGGAWAKLPGETGDEDEKEEKRDVAELDVLVAGEPQYVAPAAVSIAAAPVLECPHLSYI
jgi:hypothetical protein